jgi:DNA-binding transcriptional LysR family regulator
MLNAAKLSRIDLNLLLVFALLYEERKAGRVAERLQLSPSAVSHALRRLRTVFDDPLFLPTPKGVTPTNRADQLAPMVEDFIARAEALVASAAPFDPAVSRRRFRLGATETALAAVLPAMIARLERVAPGVDLALTTLLPAPEATGPESAWSPFTGMLDRGELDLAVLPWVPTSPRLAVRRLYDEVFVVAYRRGHPFGVRPTIEAFAGCSHVLVSATGDPVGFVDHALAERGLRRRVALTAPNFHMALEVISRTDLIGAIPRSFGERFAAHLGLDLAELPIPQPPSPMSLIAPKAALADRGVAWMFELVAELAT